MRSAGIITGLITQTARVRDGTNDSPCVNLRAVEIEGFTVFSGRKLPREHTPSKLPRAFHISIRRLTSPSLLGNTAHNHQLSRKPVTSVISGATICRTEHVSNLSIIQPSQRQPLPIIITFPSDGTRPKHGNETCVFRTARLHSELGR